MTNCIIESNNASNTVGGGGIFLGDFAGNVKIINTVIVNNTSPSNGKNITLYENTNTPKPQFINCIIWGTTNPINYYSQSSLSSDFIKDMPYAHQPKAEKKVSSLLKRLQLGKTKTEWSIWDHEDAWEINLLRESLKG